MDLPTTSDKTHPALTKELERVYGEGRNGIPPVKKTEIL